MILVTGATGFAGSHLLDRLPPDARVTAWARPGGRPPRERPRVAWQEVNLLDRDAVARAVEHAQPRTIYHLAGAPHVGSSFDNPVEPLAINALGTHYLLDAVDAHARGARVVIVTSAMIYRRSNEPHTEASPAVPSSPYGLSKLAQDRLASLAAADGLDAVIARPFNHTGARQDPSFSLPGFAQQIARIEAGLDAPVLQVGNLEAERDITDVRDVVDAYAAIAARGEAGTAYNVCSGRAWRIGDLLEMMLRLTRAPIRVEVDDARLRPVELPRLVGDNTRLRALGWEPRIPVEDMLAGVLEYWRAQAAR
ncbi:MAG TPA: GDP-mannose 4,6-dehydratase [Vicinamibacterales bacterium]